MWDLIKERKQLHCKQQSSSSHHAVDFQGYMDKDQEVKHGTQKDKCEQLENQAEVAKTAAAHNDMWTVYQTAKNHLLFQGKKWTNQSKRWLPTV